MTDPKKILRSVHHAWAKDRDPNSLAIGLAIGLFVAFLPLPAFQAVIAFFAAQFFRGNQILAVAATLVTNWFTMAPIFIGAVWVGSLILPGVTIDALTPNEFTWNSLRDLSGEVLTAYVTGTMLFSFTTGGLGYAALKIYPGRRETLRWQKVTEP